MNLLDWKPAYSLGIPSVDLEHRELIRMINETYGHMAGGLDPAAIEACLEDIYAVVAGHFALEERHMREAAYEEYDEHKQDHEALLDQILDLMDEFATDPETGRQSLQKELADWFGRHFSTYDARLHLEMGPDKT